MGKPYLKVRHENCPRCKGKGTLEVVKQGTTTAQGKELPWTEISIGWRCEACKFYKQAERK